MIKYVFFDFNGTIIDDVDLCLELLNKILKGQNKKIVNMEEYKEIFTFPIIEYYRRAGVDFNIESYESLSHKFIEEYQPRSFKCDLYKGIKDTFTYLREKGIRLYVLSASMEKNLKEQCDIFGITKYFDAILGIENIYAASKFDIANNFIINHNINPSNALFIGDTLHDFEIAKELKSNSILVSCGHQSVNVLKKANVRIIDSVADLRGIWDEISN